ncbi:hypothetical protein GH740_12255 [Microbacterium sp. SYP-A9085]|uniref:hypothetical protein n=1 Tax=Microbacterium sp. SYP-A9085 TaxID=2664454 RepID=UPI00129B7027|nr:hypothetical protein [Microbacterium sp. SYP-A9085]MRH30077.1 hypothetical protein [Microbacterium sp. SYP-A9085]
MSKSTSQHPKRRFVLPAVIGGGAASLLLALSMSPTVAAFTASIANDTNTAGSGTLIMQETSGSGSSAATCTSTDGGGIGTNSATCSTINAYGGSLALVPGTSVSTDVTIKNTGTVPARTFSLDAGACTQGDNGLVNGGAKDLCDKITVKIVSGGDLVYNGSLTAFTGQSVNIRQKLSTGPIAAGTSVSFTFTVTLDGTADNTYAGLQASQPLTWTFNS